MLCASLCASYLARKGPLYDYSIKDEATLLTILEFEVYEVPKKWVWPKFNTKYYVLEGGFSNAKGDTRPVSALIPYASVEVKTGLPEKKCLVPPTDSNTSKSMVVTITDEDSEEESEEIIPFEERNFDELPPSQQNWSDKVVATRAKVTRADAMVSRAEETSASVATACANDAKEVQSELDKTLEKKGLTGAYKKFSCLKPFVSTKPKSLIPTASTSEYETLLLSSDIHTRFRLLASEKQYQEYLAIMKLDFAKLNHRKVTLENNFAKAAKYYRVLTALADFSNELEDQVDDDATEVDRLNAEIQRMLDEKLLQEDEIEAYAEVLGIKGLIPRPMPTNVTIKGMFEDESVKWLTAPVMSNYEARHSNELDDDQDISALAKFAWGSSTNPNEDATPPHNTRQQSRPQTPSRNHTVPANTPIRNNTRMGDFLSAQPPSSRFNNRGQHHQPKPTMNAAILERLQDAIAKAKSSPKIGEKRKIVADAPTPERKRKLPFGPPVKVPDAKSNSADHVSHDSAPHDDSKVQVVSSQEDTESSPRQEQEQDYMEGLDDDLKTFMNMDEGEKDSNPFGRGSMDEEE
ncbi:hypothetical protein BJ508DRAFT_325424 [Ascobolus immersus RN42]|uniref:Uncharacterized protein n=1 Tax=Ascobolus immersus RN42 TaxID=1160509 RepID=A0A3N4IAD9_ASCIM|nr:hypothetical protein BJ508DRAFT_325424 [Ascobolus immersus RN42]